MSTPRQVLNDLLEYHGFFAAAANLEIRQDQIEGMIAQWRTYPKCMDIYPTHIQAKPKL